MVFDQNSGTSGPSRDPSDPKKKIREQRTENDMGASAHLTENGEPRYARLIVDSRDTVQTLRRLDVRPPEDRIEYCQILDVAHQIVSPEAKLDLSSEYFGMEPSRADRHIYRLDQCGFHLELTQWTENASQSLGLCTEKVVERLYDIYDMPDADPLIFAGGKIDEDEIRAVLERIAETRDVHILCFMRLSRFAIQSLQKWASVSDLVDWRLASPAVYRGVPKRDYAGDGLVATPSPQTEAGASSRDVDLPKPAGDDSALELPATSLAAAFQAAGVPSAEAPKPADPNPASQEPVEMVSRQPAAPSDDSDAQRTDSPAEAHAAHHRSALVLLDHANINITQKKLLEDSVLSKNLDTAETHLQWDDIAGSVARVVGCEAIRIVPVIVQWSDKDVALASWWKIRGQYPALLLPPPHPEEGELRRSVDDETIVELIEDMQDRWGDLVLMSHDGGYLEALEALHASNPNRRIYVAGFEEYLSMHYRRSEWIEVLDLEEDLGLFQHPLPNRYRAISVDDFDAARLLDNIGLFPKREEDA